MLNKINMFGICVKYMVSMATHSGFEDRVCLQITHISAVT